MIRRSFRIGVRLGMLFGLGYAVLRTVRGRRASESPGWDAVPATTRPVTPSPPAAPASPSPPTVAPPAAAVPEDVAAAHPLDVPEATRPLRARPAPAKRAEPSVAWVDAIGAVCPPTHPIKAKLTSRIYHVPGGQNYTRTRPDRCYADEAGAQADGLRKAQR